MPFSDTSKSLVGRELDFKPHCGNTWMLCVPGRVVQDLETPDQFDLSLKDVLFDCSEARVLICETKKIIASHLFVWAALIARSDYFVELEKESVHCNLILSKARPTTSNLHPYHHPDFVSANSDLYVRGFGVLSLKKR